MTTFRSLNALYGKWAENYDRESKRIPAIKTEENVIIPLLAPRRNDVILEIGCGTGRLTIPISKSCKRIIGIDFSQRMLEIAQQKSQKYANIEYRRADVRCGLPFRNSTFDKVIAPLVVNHIRRLDRFFREVYRVLKSDGVFVFDDVNPDSHKAKLSHPDFLAERGLSLLVHHSVDDLVHFLHRSNFEIEEIRFTRYDNKIKQFYTKPAFEKNKGRTFGVIIKARKD